MKSACDTFRYESPQDLCVITSYFNPLHYRSKRANYFAFADTLAAASIPFYTIELVFGDDSFELPEAENVTQVKGSSILWQKERLLNILLGDVPARFRKIAWVDADVLFSNPTWAVEASRALDEFRVIQLFDRAIRLPRGARAYTGRGKTFRGFASTFVGSPECLREGLWDAHGHVGFAWAARRDILMNVGFYDVCMSGSNDHLMAHSFCGDWTSKCVQTTVGHDTNFAAHYHSWSQRAFACVQGSLGFVPGDVLHLWHGEAADRRYREKNQELLAMGFDPGADIELDEHQLWRWTASKPELQKWAIDSFATRREDGNISHKL